MAVHDFRAQRLFLEADLAEGVLIAASRDQANYLRNVLRLSDGAAILVFNGREGEWCARLRVEGRKACSLVVETRVRAQYAGPDLNYLFAPLKHARLDYMVQKATELGVARLQPVMTRHTVPARVNVVRMQSNVIEAAEQCGVLRVPVIDAPCSFSDAVGALEPDRHIIFADEAADIASPIEALRAIPPRAPCALIVGPEGGFSESERTMLHSLPRTTTISLGPRIMRADTAAVAALALVNAVVGDWREAEH